MRVFVLLLAMAVLLTGPAVRAADDLHADFDLLLARYVTESGVRYDDWAGSSEDRRLLTAYIDGLEATPPGDLDQAAALAYWINLYNAVTLELVLAHYPVDSIKDTAGFLRSPWNKKLVTVEGDELSLNAIEHEIIRKRFPDARIHFALNCASVGCPPLAGAAYRGESLDDQLDNACRRAFHDPRWVRIEDDGLVLSRIFDWYREDFEKDAGSVKAFIARYRKDGIPGTRKITYADYDWSLNRSR